MESKYFNNFRGFCEQWSVDSSRLRSVLERYPFCASRYACDLVQSPGDPIWCQIVPERAEIENETGFEDPLAEESLTAVPNLVHRYPSRVLWLVSDICAVHCRFCTRKRRWGHRAVLRDEIFKAGLDYIRDRHEIQDVLLSGGDPFLLPPERLEAILSSLRSIRHVQIVRIGTRVPTFLPQIVTRQFADMLARYHPLYVNIHFNHPREITRESAAACARLANVGVPLGSQTVLLRGVNDNVEILAELFQRLLTLRVRPYYLMQMDLTRGTGHFRTPIHEGLRIVHGLRNRISGLAMPQFVLDLPGGQGKIPLLPNYVLDVKPDVLSLRDWLGRPCDYPLLSGESERLLGWLRGDGQRLNREID